MSDTLSMLTAQAMGYAWGQQDAGIGRALSAHHFAHHFRALRSQPNCPSVQDAWLLYVAKDGNTVRENHVDRCACGCKYWRDDACIDCGGSDVEPEQG